MEIEVVSIAVSDLNDPEALNKNLRKLARKIGRKDLQKKYKFDILVEMQEIHNKNWISFSVIK